MISERYRIVQSRPNPIGLEVASPPIVLAAAERLSVAAAIAHLDLTGAPVAIFTNKVTGRLHALYARYDGHYGLMAPPEPSGELIGPDDRRRTGCAT
ncbi:sigma 54 modulation/S30EA ribosomal C-terminal domain-containing protein [Kribbella sp. NPDC000426]|uniref:sigma 54 modulation/S30EA ribosomal C-terminal domain-containing protein n=1 Tax=Kribbella sp. NPDC000426 TaxID=3154255 RepID=UPI00331E53F3